MKMFHLKKMETKLEQEVIYQLKSKDNILKMNELIGEKLSIKYDGKIKCICCGTEIKKSFGQGYCYQCFVSVPQTDICILNPEKCLAHEGVSRNMEWAKKNCLKPHYVYLAKTNKIKVGVTRENQIPTRWIDQGAYQAVKLAKTPYRQLAGRIEVEMKTLFSDKTSWQSMLKNIITSENLIDAKNKAIEFMSKEFLKFVVSDNQVVTISYPHLTFPPKVKSVKLDKVSEITGILTAIKGQYLIFDNLYVFNVRSHTGYVVYI